MNAGVVASARLVMVLCACTVSSSGQDDGKPSAGTIVRQIMTTDLARCRSSENGIARIEFSPSTDAEVAQIRSLGTEAIPPLTAFIRIRPQDGFTQLFAVSFLGDIGGPATFAPLAQAFALDQWEATRAAALDEMFAVSPVKARPYVSVGLTDQSRLIRQHATHLWSLYGEDGPPIG